MQFSFKLTFAMVALGSFATLAAVAQAQPKLEWKDRAEYDLADSIKKEQNATTKLQLLKTWKEKYPPVTSRSTVNCSHGRLPVAR